MAQKKKKNRHGDQWDKIEGPDINSQSYSCMVSIKDAKNTHWSKDDLCKKSRMSDPYLLTSIKIKWAETLNCSWKTQSKHLKTCMPLSE